MQILQPQVFQVRVFVGIDIKPSILSAQYALSQVGNFLRRTSLPLEDPQHRASLRRDLSLRRFRATQQTFGAEVLIHVGPVDAVPNAPQFSNSYAEQAWRSAGADTTRAAR